MEQFEIKNKEKVISECQRLIDNKISEKNLNSEKFNFEKNILKELNVKEKVFNSKEEYYLFFNQFYEKILENLKKEIQKYDKDLLTFYIINLESLLAKISFIKLNGVFEDKYIDKKRLPKLKKRIEMIKRSKDHLKYKLFLNDVNTNVGFYKKGLDTIMNLILNMENYKENEKINKYRMHILILEACQLWYIFTLLKTPYNEKIYVKDFKIWDMGSKDEYIEASVNYAYQDFNNGLDEEVFNELYDLYEKKVKYSPKMLMKYCENVESKEMPQIFSQSELKDLCTLDTLPLEGFKNLYNDLVLKSNPNIFDKNNRVSKKGIIQISNDKYIFDKNIFIQYIILLNKKMTDPNFSGNSNIIKFINKKITERWLKELQKNLQENDIWFEINQNVSNDIVDDRTKKVSKEIDLLLHNKSNDILMIVEYKNWGKKAYDSVETNKEINKIKKHVKKRVELIKLIKNSMQTFLSNRSKYFDTFPKLELFIVFEERNVLCEQIEYLDDIKISYLSVRAFESYIDNNISNLQK